MLWFGIGAVLVLVAGWFLVQSYLAPRYRPDRGPGETHGLDVSHFQGVIDWDAVAADGIDFTYIKATEAGDWVDERLASNWASARAAGLDVGEYHFFTLCRTGEDQAANFLSVPPIDEADLPPAVDLEFPGNCSDRPPKDELQRELRSFLDIVEAATGRRVLLYVEDEFDARYGIFDTFDGPTWERSLRRRPGDDRWVIWQATDVARVDGVSGGVDLNLMSAECCS